MNTSRSKIRGAKGFTVIELMVVALIVIIVIAGAYGAYKSMHETWLAEDIKADMQQGARAAMDNMVREIMMLGYGSDPDYKIITAERSVLEFREYMKDDSYKEYRLKYYKDAGALKRDSQKITPPPTATATGTLAENIESLSFYYYDESDSDMGAPVTGVDNLKDIRRIKVVLKVKSDKKMPGTDEYKTMTLTADLSPRNLWEGEVSMDSEPPPQVSNLHVIDTLRCGALKATWDVSTADDIAGYLIKYGTASGVYVRYQDVPAETAGDPPMVEFPVDINEFTTSPPVPYYLIIQAYDNSHNYSTSTSEVTSTNPFVNVTGFGNPDNDTVNNIPKPAAPAVFTADNSETNPAECTEDAVLLKWTKSTDPNVVGYRLYRSDTYFDPATLSVVDDALPAGVTMIARESESGVAWPDEDKSDVGGANDGSYLDDDPSLNGCQTYYYAVCAVTCDRTHITGGNYTSEQYKTVIQEPKETTPPPSPDMTNSTAGWRRAFLTLRNPSVAQSPDFERTEIYFRELTQAEKIDWDPNDPQLPSWDSETKSVVGGTLIPDSDCGVNGTFRNRGSQTILFDSKDEVSPIEPELTNAAQYNILAVSYDKCGNTSAESTTIVLIDLCGDDPVGPPPDAPVDPVFFSCDPTLVEFSWSYPPKSWSGTLESATPQQYDFAGYRLWRLKSDTMTLTELNPDAPTWGEYWSDSTALEGGTYYYTVRATDCVYENVHSEYPFNYSSPLTIGPVQPGKAVLANSLALTEGTYHNKVKFYLENTSHGELELTQINLSWGNQEAYIKNITIGPALVTTTNEIAVGQSPLPDYLGTTVPVNNVFIKDVAGAPGLRSARVPVTLEFVNSDGTVNEITDMRTDIIDLNYTYKKVVSSSLECTTDDMRIFVTGGPSINFTIQDRPNNPTDSFAIFGCSTSTVLSSGYPVVGGGQTVTVTTNITKPSIETLSDVRLNYALTGKDVVSPLAYTFSSITSGTQSGNNYSTDLIPVAADQGVWYYVVARTVVGNEARAPKNDDSFFYYYQEPFDMCNENPEPPGNVQRASDTTGDIAWEAPALYQSGVEIPDTDTIVYDVYRRVLGGAYGLAQSDGTGLSATSYTDTTAIVAGTNYEYAVKSRNACGNASTTYSDSVIFCGGGAGCVISLEPAGAMLDTVWTTGSETCTSESFNLSVFICNRYKDTHTWATEDVLSDITMTVSAESRPDLTTKIRLYEIGDTGVFTMTGTADAAIYVNALTSNYNDDFQNTAPVTNVQQRTFGATSKTSLDDVLTFAPGTANPSEPITGCSAASQTVDITTDPCANTPVATVIRSAERNNKNIDSMTWDAVTTNTDGSPAVYSSDSVSYQVWYAVSTETDLNNFALLGTSSTTSFSTTSPATQVESSNTTYKFYVKAVDTCAPANSSVASNVITLEKTGSYSNP